MPRGIASQRAVSAETGKFHNLEKKFLIGFEVGAAKKQECRQYARREHGEEKHPTAYSELEAAANTVTAGATPSHARSIHNNYAAQESSEKALGRRTAESLFPGGGHRFQCKSAAGKDTDQASEEGPHKEQHALRPI